MIKFRKGSIPLFIACFISIFTGIFSNSANAESYTTTGPNDFYFTFEEPQNFTVRTYAWQNQIDSMLWLYDSNNQQLAANDDHFGLDSYISINLQPGTYRLRTGVCCGDPNRWYGNSYQFETSTSLISDQTTTTSTSSTTTVPPTTTSTSTSTTSTTTTTTTTSTTTTSTTTTTTSTTVAPTTTTIPPTTTIFVVPTTTSSSTTSTTTSTTTTSTTTTSTTIPATTTTTTIPEVVNEISQEEAVAAATSPEKLESVSKEEAEEIFSSIDTSEITEEQKDQIIEAVQDAPEEVKEAFEGEINIYADGFDEYVPVGSTITVKARRTLLAAVGAISSMTVVGGSATGGSSPSGGGSNTPSGSGKDSQFKKDEEDEEEDEEAPEIEGPEGGDEEIFTRNSIFKYKEDGMRKFSIWNFIKKFSKETAALAFTISSTIIVFATLSGDTRKITLIATSCAFLVHYISVMIKNDE